MFTAFRCEICGETYLGKSKPKTCPYCGAQEEYLKKLENFERLMPEDISDESRENIEEAIKLEIDNAKFYDCAYRKTEDESEAAIFKRLKKIEAEHAEFLAEIIDVPEEEIPSYEECAENAIENYQEAHERENRAIQSYSQFAHDAENSEVKEIFEALVDIETDHLDLSDRKTSS